MVGEQIEFQKPTHNAVGHVDRAAAQDYRVDSQLVAECLKQRADVGRMMLGRANGW